MKMDRPAFESLASALGAGQVVADPAELVVYEMDGGLSRGQPEAVAFPRSLDEMAAIVKWANEHAVPLVARGAGTGLSGGAVPHRGGLIVEFSRMRSIPELDEVGRSAVVEPGVVNQAFDEFVKAHGLFYPADPASGRACTLGGNIAENSGGPHCFKYGVTTNYVTGMDLVLASGRQVRLGGRALDYPGYDLVGLVTGSEGTLGLVGRAYVRLLTNPPAVKTMMAAFDSVEAAGEAVSAVIARGLVPATLEMMDQKVIQIVEDYTHAGLPTDAGAILIIEADGYPESLPGQAEEIVATLQAHAARELRTARTAEERETIWYGRKSAIGALARIARGYLLVDGTVPRSALARTLASVNQICERHGLRVGYVFHAGDGNLHPLVLIQAPEDPEHMRHIHAAAREILVCCVEQGGTITGEHGVGIEKRAYMQLMYTAGELQLMRDIKEVFDPGHRLNPDKIFPDEETGSASSSIPAGPQIDPAAPLSPSGSPAVRAPRPPGTAGDTGEGSSLANERGAAASPASAEEAAECIREWSRASKPIRVRGAGTKSNLLPPVETTLSTLALQGCTHSLDDLYVSAGAGLPLAEMQRRLAGDGMWVPLESPWAEATVGGTVAANCNAPLRMRYGGVRDLVLAMTVVLPDGRTARFGRPVVKNVAGYDMVKLFVGSQGTLGLIADVTFKLVALPRVRTTVVVATGALEQGLALGGHLLRRALVASALLLCRGWDAAAGWGGGAAGSYRLIYTAEGLAEEVAAELRHVRARVEEAGCTETAEFDSPSGSGIWGDWMRRTAPKDTALRLGTAPKDLPPLLREHVAAIGDGSWVADLANGMLYLRNPRDLKGLREAARAVGGYTALLAGPRPQSTLDAWGYIPEGLELMQALRARWDPRGLFNPGVAI